MKENEKEILNVANYDRLGLNILRVNCKMSNPMNEDFCYADAFKKLNYWQVKKDLYKLIITSQKWWPADYGTYGPLFIRMAWHSAGTYRVGDGRGGSSRGTQRLAPINSWPDNANLDKARRLLWPIKQKYGDKLSWADLFILAGNCSLESMGLKTIGFAGGREDVYVPQIDVDWGSEKEWLGNTRSDEPGELKGDLAAIQMGLIYVNPQGPNNNPDPLESAKDVRVTFERMAMNDRETVALIAGGHTFGKCHGAAPATYVGPAPESAPIEQQGLGWKNSFGTGNADDTITSGIEGAWKPNPNMWDMGYFKVLLKYEWEVTKSPAGAYQWTPKDIEKEDMVVDAFDKDKFHPPMMTTADMALKYDKAYHEIAIEYSEDPQAFEKAFADAWFKLTHRDMGPVSRYLGPEIPHEQFIWQDPLPRRTYKLIDKNDIAMLKRMIISSNLSISQLVCTAWESASTYRGSDRRGGANGGRICLEPQRHWQVNEPHKLDVVLNALKTIQERFNSYNKTKQVSIADLIVLGGCVGIELAASNGGFMVEVPFTPGRVDALQCETDVESFNYLEPKADGFRNYIKEITTTPEKMLVDRSQLLNLTAPEMTVLLGGLRVLNINYNNCEDGVLTDKVGCLTNDFFVNLLDMDIKWEETAKHSNKYIGVCASDDSAKWTATSVDLIFGADSQLRALCEVYASKGNEKKFVDDFISAWVKVMNNDRFDLKKHN